MGLSFVNPHGFRFFIVSGTIAILMLSLVKSIVDVLPHNDILRFSIINGLGFIIFISSIWISRNISDAKQLWFVNGFSISGAVLIVYSMSVEIRGAVHEMIMPFFHIIEISAVIYIANRLIKYSDQERWTELQRFPTTNTNSFTN